jgi:hypothetical protein
VEKLRKAGLSSQVSGKAVSPESSSLIAEQIVRRAPVKQPEEIFLRPET